MSKDKFALISVYNKEGIVDFARELINLGWRIISSEGTVKKLKENDVIAIDVSMLVGGDAILGHRVVTLSRQLHAGLLAVPGKDDKEMAELGFNFIDMVVCDFYPLSKAIADPNATIESVVEMTDIDGPTMVRSAAKGGRIVVCDPEDRELVIERLQKEGDVDPTTRQYLRAKAEFIVAKYCLDSTRFHSNGTYNGFIGKKVLELAYGENKDQSPATLFAISGNDPLAMHNFQPLADKDIPGYINLADGDRALQVLCLLAEACRRNFKGKVPYITVACKHGNPCGLGVDWENPMNSLIKALMGDPLAVMGAEVMMNFEITDEIANNLNKVPEDLVGKVGRKSWILGVIFAPKFSNGAIEILVRRRLLQNEALFNPTMPPDEWMYRPMRGGFIRQKAPTFVLELGEMEDQTKMDMLIAWAVAWRATSNTIAIAKNNMLLALGCGQQDRIACVVLCLERAARSGHDTQNSAFASDAFFPFAARPNEEAPLEGTELLVQAGCTTGIVPADGIHLEEVREFFSNKNIKVIYLPPEHRGFSQH